MQTNLDKMRVFRLKSPTERSGFCFSFSFDLVMCGILNYYKKCFLGVDIDQSKTVKEVKVLTPSLEIKTLSQINEEGNK